MKYKVSLLKKGVIFFLLFEQNPLIPLNNFRYMFLIYLEI